MPSLPPTQASVGPPMNQRARNSGSTRYCQTVSIGAARSRSKRSICGVIVSAAMVSAILRLRDAAQAFEDHRPALAGLVLICGPGGVHFVGERKDAAAGAGCDVDSDTRPLALLRGIGGEEEDEPARSIHH